MYCFRCNSFRRLVPDAGYSLKIAKMHCARAEGTKIATAHKKSHHSQRSAVAPTEYMRKEKEAGKIVKELTISME